MKPIVSYFTTNICYNSAKPYTSNQRGHLIDKKKLRQGEMGKIWSINPLLAITHNTFFYSIICSTAITNHAFSIIEVYVNTFIDRDIAYYCRCIQRVEGLLAQNNIYKTRRFVTILTTMKHTFLLITTVKCYVSGRVELTQKVRCPIDV